MPDMSEYHETEDQMEGRCDSQRKAEKEGGDFPRPMGVRVNCSVECFCEDHDYGVDPDGKAPRGANGEILKG
jgi:hypothetical protein